MALSIEELELQAIDLLPAREVMSAVITGPTDSEVGSYTLEYDPTCVFVEGNHDNVYGDGDLNGWNTQVVGETATLGGVEGVLPFGPIGPPPLGTATGL
jgi:hypothetical protein